MSGAATFSKLATRFRDRFRVEFRFLLILIIISFCLHILRSFIVLHTLQFGGIGWGNLPHESFWDIAPVWDGGFYKSIAQNWYGGYEGADVGFPPFYPICIRILSLIFPFNVSMVLINSFCLVIATPILAYLVSSELFREKAKIRLCTIIVTLNPFIVAWGTIGLAEPLGYVIGLALVYSYLRDRYLLSALLFSVGILTRFAFVVAGGLFLYSVVIERKLKNTVPLLAGGITYIGWNLYTKVAYGLTNTEVREIFWHHLPGIKWGDISMYAQLSDFVVVGLLLLLTWTYCKKKEDKIAALLLWAVAAYLLISIFPVYGYGQLRWVGFILPLFLLLEGFDEWRAKTIICLSVSWSIVTIVVAPQIYQLYIGALDQYRYLYMADLALVFIAGTLLLQYLNGKYRFAKMETIAAITFSLAGLCLAFVVVRIF